MVPMPSKMLISGQLVHSAALELQYQNSVHAVELLAKEEDVRRLRFDIHVLEDDNDELREQIQHGEERANAFEELLNEHVAREEAAEARIQDMETDLRTREWELQAVIAEKQALEYTSADATAALVEKLALTRELSILKPELEHLKAQVASTEALTAEKLALLRENTELQCEVENARREAKRALAKRRNTGVEIAQEEQVDDLKRQLAKEKRARARAEQAAENGQGDTSIDDIRKQLSKERKARQKAEEELEVARETTQLEDVRKDLLKEKKSRSKLEEMIENLRAEVDREKKAAARAAQRADVNTLADFETENLRGELAKEKKERIRAEKVSQQIADEFEAQKATLEDRLRQFREKLQKTKATLKETEAELSAAREAAAVAKRTATIDADPAKGRKTKKRNAGHMDADAMTLGTPGDGPKGKRLRKASAGVGDKSTFSITPFLNRTVSVMAEEEDDEDESDEDAATATVTATATAHSPAAIAAKKQPLAPKPAQAPNKKPAAQRKPKSKPMLAMVTEEENEDVHSHGQENNTTGTTRPYGIADTQTLQIKTKDTDGPTEPPSHQPAKPTRKFRKSIADIPLLAAEPEIKKKKRKLGGLGKTVFDDDDDNAGSYPTATASKGLLLGGKGFGGFGGGGIKKGGLLGGKTKVGSLMLTATDGSGFQFSPLKKARRNLDDTLRGF